MSMTQQLLVYLVVPSNCQIIRKPFFPAPLSAGVYKLPFLDEGTAQSIDRDLGNMEGPHRNISENRHTTGYERESSVEANNKSFHFQGRGKDRHKALRHVKSWVVLEICT